MAIIGYPACKDALTELLSQITARMDALPPDDDDALSAAVVESLGELSDFEVASLPADMMDAAENLAITKLDKLSMHARHDLALGSLGAIIAGIRARADELVALTATLDQHTAVNVAAEKRISLIPIRNAILSITATVESLKTLKKNLQQANPDEAQILASIEMLIAKFDGLRTSMNDAGVNV